MIYILVFLHTILYAFIYNKRKRYILNKKIFILKKFFLFIIMILPAIIIAGIRYGISIDYFKVYVKGFNIITNNLKDSEFEIGFTYLVKLCSLLLNESWFMFFFVSAITIIIYFISFNYSKNYFISTILFFITGIYFDSFNGIRQYIVCSIFLYCYKFIIANNWKYYFLIMGLCILIHTSAIFTLPFFFLSKIKINKKYYIIILCFLLLFNEQLYKLIIFIISLIPKYNQYILRNTITLQISFSASGVITAAIALFPCIFIETKMLKFKEGFFLYNMMMFGLLIAISSSFFPFAERLLYYSKTYILLAIPYACSLFNKKRRIFFESIILGLLSCMNFIGIFFLNWYAVLPYITIFDK